MALAAVCLSTPAFAALVTVNPEADTRLLNSGYANSNFGGGTYLFAGNLSGFIDRALIRFDLSAYAGQTVVGNGTLTLKVRLVDGPTGAGAAQTLSVSLLDAANEGWTEGTGNDGGVVQSGTAVWNFKSYNGTAWPGGGTGLGGPGAGYGAVALDSVSALFAGGNTITFTIPQATIQSWITAPGTLVLTGIEDTSKQRVSPYSKDFG